MKRLLIDQLLWNAPPMDNEVTRAVHESRCQDGAAVSFLECQIVLEGGYSVSGVLTDAIQAGVPDGTIRLLTPGKRTDNSLVLADHYFDADDIVAIVVARDLPRAPTILRAA